MADKNIRDADKLVDEAVSLSTGNDQDDVNGGGGGNILSWLTKTGDIAPPWWSRARDRALSNAWRENNHLSIAVYNTQAKITGIPLKIVAKDRSNPKHNAEAEDLLFRLMVASEFGKSWHVAYSKFIEDLLTQDNGGFMEIIGDGSPDGPIIGLPVGVRHLDSSRCTRTGNYDYPVIYSDRKGKMFKIHRTRIMYMSQMPSSRVEMHDVGFCSISRSIEIASTLLDITRYKQERLGSRPQNQLLVGKGITAKQIMTALKSVNNNLDSKGFTRYAQTVAIGSEATDIGIEKVDLNHLDPFNEEIGINLGMFAIAAAFGMDAEEIWPVSGRSSNKAESSVKRMRSRGRLPAQITQEITTQFSYKLLPSHLTLEFDFKDDEEDQQRAVIRDIRGRNRERDLGDGAINVRASRTMMLNDGDVSQVTFDDMELSDGRLPNGRTISILFFDPDPVISRLLNFMTDPLSILGNVRADDKTSRISDEKVDDVLVQIQDQRQVVLKGWASTRSPSIERRHKQAFHALDWLEEQYQFVAGRLLPSVPIGARNLRQDIRVAPEEDSPDKGDVSSAQQAQSGNAASSENQAQND